MCATREPWALHAVCAVVQRVQLAALVVGDDNARVYMIVDGPEAVMLGLVARSRGARSCFDLGGLAALRDDRDGLVYCRTGQPVLLEALACAHVEVRARDEARGQLVAGRRNEALDHALVEERARGETRSQLVAGLAGAALVRAHVEERAHVETRGQLVAGRRIEALDHALVEVRARGETRSQFVAGLRRVAGGGVGQSPRLSGHEFVASLVLSPSRIPPLAASWKLSRRFEGVGREREKERKG